MNWLLVRVGPPLRAIRGVVGNPAIRRAELAFLCFNVAEVSTWIAILVYAFQRGGASATGLVGFVLLLPAAFVAPVAAALGDRYRRERVAALGYLAQAITTGATAVTMAADAPEVVVYAVATLAMTTYTTGRPSHHALLPRLARSPDELTAGNSISSLAEGVGGTIGTIAVTILLAVSTTAAVYGAMALVLALAAAVANRIHGEPAVAVASVGRLGAWALVSEAGRGLMVIARSRDPRLLVALAAVLTLVWGMYDVLLVTAALDVLDVGEAGVGALHTVLGVGVLVGAAGSVVLVGRSRLAPALALGAIVLGLGAAATGATEIAAVAALGAGTVGAAITLVDVVGRTLLQRVADDAVLTRVFGVIETLWMLGVGLGSALAAGLVALVGLTTAFAVTALALPLATVVAYAGLRRLDREAVVPVRQLELLSRLSMFAPLARTALERVARQLDRVAVSSGEDLIRQGDVGDRFYLVDSGRFDVLVDGRRVAALAEGDHFGEIALLHDVPRTATVRAVTAGVVWALDQEEFLATVTGLPQAASAAHEISAERMRQNRSEADGEPGPPR